MTMNYLKKMFFCFLTISLVAGFFACSGENGVDGKDGIDGRDGRDGKDGVDGRDGKNGVTDTIYVVKDTVYIERDTVFINRDTVYIVSDNSSSSNSQTGSGACTTQVYESDYHKVLVDCGNYSFIAENVKDQPAAKWGENLVDERGGKTQTYKTVIIGDQTWMAENLNYAVNDGEQSWCYDDKASNCTKYGRLYTWAAAVGKSEDECGSGHTCSLPSGNIQGVCPDGWHLPSRAEWTTLNDFVDAHNGTVGVGTDLKSLTGWSSGNGNDLFAFSALPAGYRYYNGGFSNEGGSTDFWSSTESNETNAYNRSLDYGHDDFNEYNDYQYYAFSVRCLKDS